MLDTTLILAIHRVRACRHGLFAGETSFGRCVSKTEWVYGFKVALTVDPQGVMTTFGLAPATSDERPIAEVLIAVERYPGYLADKGYASLDWERHWAEQYENLVAATSTKTADVEQETQRKELGMLSEGDVVCRSQFLKRRTQPVRSGSYVDYSALLDQCATPGSAVVSQMKPQTNERLSVQFRRVHPQRHATHGMPDVHGELQTCGVRSMSAFTISGTPPPRSSSHRERIPRS